MIASIEGIISDKSHDMMVVLVGGVGIEVWGTRTALEMAIIGEHVQLITRLLVREDALTLYGFSHKSERDVFDTLLKINGVGAKLAIMILSTLSLDNLRSAVTNDRVEILTRVPGIGKKTAQKILLELRDKLPIGLDALPGDGGIRDNLNNDLMDALISLGFSVVESQTAIQSLPADAPQDLDERLRLALQLLSR